MKKITLYISFSLFFASVSFSAEKEGSSVSVFNDNFSLFEGHSVIAGDNSSDNVVLRKRAHKRKRKIRPRRNGF